MKKLFFIAFLLYGLTETKAQNGFQPGDKIGFEYDAAGNRVRRFLIVDLCPGCPNPNGNRTAPQEKDSVTVGPNQQSLSIKVFPNPTDKDITVQINGFELLSETPLLTMSDVNGKIVLTRQLNSNNSLIDLSELTRVTYYLYVNTEYNKMTYKVIKSK
jgi:hypothetical protein